MARVRKLTKGVGISYTFDGWSELILAKSLKTNDRNSWHGTCVVGWRKGTALSIGTFGKDKFMSKTLKTALAAGAMALGVMAVATPANAILWIEAIATNSIVDPVTRFAAPEVFVVNSATGVEGGVAFVDAEVGINENKGSGPDVFDALADTSTFKRMDTKFKLGGYDITTFTTFSNSIGINGSVTGTALFISDISAATIAFGDEGYVAPEFRGLALRLFDDGFTSPVDAYSYASSFDYSSIATGPSVDYRAVSYDTLAQSDCFPNPANCAVGDGGKSPLAGAQYFEPIDLLNGSNSLPGSITVDSSDTNLLGNFSGGKAGLYTNSSGRFALLHQYLIKPGEISGGIVTFGMQTSVSIPEPASLGLFGLGLLGIGALRRKKAEAAA
jgi:hypothetical protein